MPWAAGTAPAQSGDIPLVHATTANKAVGRGIPVTGQEKQRPRAVVAASERTVTPARVSSKVRYKSTYNVILDNKVIQ